MHVTKRRWTNAALALSMAVLLLPLVAAPADAAQGADSVAVAPQAFGANYTTPSDHELTVSLTASAFDGGPIVDFTIVSGPQHGSLDDCGDGTCRYRSDPGFVGTDTFTFTAFDGSFFSNEAIVTILVVPACQPGACIDNGTVLLGINPEGHLNIRDAAGSPAGDRDAGLHFLPTRAEGTSAGCDCEGWGIADAASGIAGHANVSVGGVRNLDLVEFSSTATTARSVVSVDDAIEVTHDFRPSPRTDSLFEIGVTIENTSAAALDDIRYRRVMDWDIEPTPFQEFVTVDTGNAANLRFASNHGFANPNPLTPPTDSGQTGSFEDAGPADQGALFDFAFGPLAPGEQVTFRVFYGAARTETDAVAALAAAGAEVYSFGQPNTADGAAIGAPNTFILAFADVGGQPLFAPVATDDELVVEAGTEATLDVVANDTDPNADPLTIVDHSDPAAGTASCTEAGLCTYFADPGFAGPDSFTYTIADGTGGEAVGMVNVTVTEPPVPVNLPPIVSAGAPVETTQNEPVLLDGSAFDPDGDPLFVLWSTELDPFGLPIETGCLFAESLSARTMVTCTEPGVFEVKLTAIDGHNEPVSETTTVTVTEPPVPVNLPPVVSAGDPVEAAPDQLIILDGSAVDPDGDPLGFAWATDATTCTLGSPGSANTTVSCAAPGVHLMTLAVDDGHNPPIIATTTVTITEPTAPVNEPPAVSAGNPVETRPDEPVALDGSAFDPDGDLVTADWKVDPATTCVFADAASLDTLVTCSLPGAHVLTLSVDDGYNPPVFATTTVTVLAMDPIFPTNEPPLVSAGLDLATGPDQPVTLDGSVFDPDGDIVALRWHVEPDPLRPATAFCDLADPTRADTAVTCTEVAVFALTLTADDGHNPPVSDTTLVTVTTAGPAGPAGEPVEQPGGEPGGQPGDPSAACTEGMQLELDTYSFLGNRDRHRFSETVDVALSCDRYRILLGSVDESHRAGYQTVQKHEQWSLEGLDADGNVVFRSPLTDDLADDETSSVTDVGIADLDGVVSFRAHHAGRGNSVNSIHELTVRLDPVAGP